MGSSAFSWMGLASGGSDPGRIVCAAGWLPHTTRAAITRLRQRGYDVRITTNGGRKVYQLNPAV